jgi:uncharacterized protein (TIGR04255 family)
VNKDKPNIVDFDNPPLVEVVCGVQFKPVHLFTPHIGLLWQQYQPEYPVFREMPPLLNQPQVLPHPAIPLGLGPPLRMCFMQQDQTWVVQIQADRLITNWKKIGQAEYPRFEQIENNFRSNFEKFIEFARKAGIAEIQPLFYDLTYVNHITKDNGFTSFGSIGDILPDFAWRNSSGRFLNDIKGLAFNASFQIEKTATLVISTAAGKSIPDRQDIFQLTLKITGSADNMSPSAWFNRTHHWMNAAFTDITSEKIQTEQWKRCKPSKIKRSS